jgi:hypothetical protein
MIRWTVKFTMTYILIVITYTLNGQNTLLYKSHYTAENEFIIEEKLNNHIHKFSLDSPRPFSLSNYTIIKEENSFTLISNTSSEIYREVRDTLRHFGSDQQHYGLQFSPYIYVDTVLYSFGGYGYWTTKNILRYWDDDNGWVPVALPESSMGFQAAHSSNLYYSEPFLYIVGGRLQSSKNPLISHPVRLLQKINLVTKQVQIDDLPLDYWREKLVHRDGDTLIVRDNDKFLLFQITTNNVLELLPTEKYLIVSKQNDIFLEGNVFRNSSGKTYSFDSLFFVKSNKEYKASNILFLSIGVVIILIIVLKLTNGRKKSRSSFILKNDLIYFDKRSLKLDPNEVLILELFRSSRSKNVQEINAVLPDILSLSHKNKLRLALINTINAKAYEVSGNTINEILKREKSHNDSRMSLYSLVGKLEF